MLLILWWCLPDLSYGSLPSMAKGGDVYVVGLAGRLLKGLGLDPLVKREKLYFELV